ncbi:MAG: L-threonine 3-dehydrogenase, partial [Mucinivorans sp.]
RFMDMMYMPDAMTAMHDLMEADPSRLIVRNSYNVASMSFSPGILFSKIKERIPAFDWEYQIDPVKDQISDSWPNFLDDSCARREWDWAPAWNSDTMVDDMIKVLGERLAKK